MALACPPAREGVMAPLIRVAIDLVPMAAGHGGTGSGIWTYAENLLLHLDRCVPQDMELLVFARRPQIENLKSKIKNLQLLPIAWPCKGIVSRLLWIHLALPCLCWRHRVTVLHKLATETPWFCPARRVTTLHDFYYEFLQEHTPPEQRRWHERWAAAYFCAMTRRGVRQSAALIVVSQSVQNEVALRYPDAASKTTVIYHGAPAAAGDAGQGATAHAPVPPFTLLYPAKFMEYKGQLRGVDVMEQWLALHPENRGRIKLVFRGYANDRHYMLRLRERVQHSPAGDHIGFVDYVSAATPAEIYRGCQAMLLLSSYEGFGLPIIEAQSLGLPVVCSDLPVFHEIGGAGVSGAHPQPALAVVERLQRLMSDPAFYAAEQQQGFQNARRFDWNHAAQQTVAVYRAAGT